MCMYVHVVKVYVIVLIQSKFHINYFEENIEKSHLSIIKRYAIFSPCRTRQIVSIFKVPATLITSCAIFGSDFFVFSGKSLLDGVVVDTDGQFSDNPSDGKIYKFRNAIPCGGYCDKPIR